MSNGKKSWIRDVEELLEQSVIEDAVSRVMNRLDEAIQSLEPEGRDLLSRYFDGVGVEQLSREKKITPEELSLWIARLKRELNQHLRSRCSVRQ